MDWDSPTAADVYARFEPAVQLQRDWPGATEAGLHLVAEALVGAE